MIMVAIQCHNEDLNMLQNHVLQLLIILFSAILHLLSYAGLQPQLFKEKVMIMASM